MRFLLALREERNAAERRVEEPLGVGQAIRASLPEARTASLLKRVVEFGEPAKVAVIVLAPVRLGEDMDKGRQVDAVDELPGNGGSRAQTGDDLAQTSES